MFIPAAIHLYKVTDDPMLLDAIRVISTPDMPEFQVRQAENYIRATYDAYLTLFRNSSTHRLCEFRLPDHPSN